MDCLEITRMVFRLWHLYREGTIDRATLQQAMAPIQQVMHLLLVQGARRWRFLSGRERFLHA